MTPIEQDLKLRYETILKWVLSCDKSEQIPVCKEAIDALILKRFSPCIEKEQLKKIDVAQVLADLWEALEIQKLTIAGSKKDERQDSITNGLDNQPVAL